MTAAPRFTALACAIAAVIATSGLAIHRAEAGPTPAPQPSPSSSAPSSSASSLEKADKLFNEGRALLSSNLLEACEKFDESLRENPAAIGTLLNVALCDEKLGRVATAATRFTEARSRALELGLPEHVRAADDHLATLAPLVPHLAIALTTPLPDTQVLVDDRVIQPADRTDVAVDPGEHVVVVSAPDRLPYRAHIIIAKSEHQVVSVPELASAIVVRSSGRMIGQITTIVGGTATLTGLGLGLYASHLYHAQFGHQQPGDGLCNAAGMCEPTGQTNTQRARTLGNVGTIVGLLGLAATATGGYLWYRSPAGTPSEADKKLTIAPDLGPTSLGLTAIGRF